MGVPNTVSKPTYNAEENEAAAAHGLFRKAQLCTCNSLNICQGFLQKGAHGCMLMHRGTYLNCTEIKYFDPGTMLVTRRRQSTETTSI